MEDVATIHAVAFGALVATAIFVVAGIVHNLTQRKRKRKRERQ